MVGPGVAPRAPQAVAEDSPVGTHADARCEPAPDHRPQRGGTEVTPHMHDITAFQRDVLRRLAVMDGADSGLDIKEQLEARDGYTAINHGRLYPNLDAMVEMGLVVKEQVDGRTNSYRLSRRGEREVEEHAMPWLEALAAVTDEQLAFDEPKRVTAGSSAGDFGYGDDY